MLNFCDFIRVFVLTTNHHLNIPTFVNSIFVKLYLTSKANNVYFLFAL